ncbi:MAG: hypothetical protein HRT45_14515 [Bdellovibrionales bacterium]|nr:hypothetical protein [Bdellovibrionales bacterium]
MRQTVSSLTQSRFYSPVFNAAVFDGPIRIYFSQSQESEALRVYFQLQEKLSDIYQDAKTRIKESGRNIFIMLYPNSETFDLSFSPMQGEFDAPIASEVLGDDFVLGVRGPVGELEFVRIQEGLFQILNSQLAPEPFVSSTL